MYINIYIRIIFTSLMLLPPIVLLYFLISIAKDTDCMSSYLKNKQNKSDLIIKNIPWPANGLLTLWFDSGFFGENKDEILDLMSQYQFKGVISLTNRKSCYAQFISTSELNLLQAQGWEITGVKPRFDTHEINEMPATDEKNLVAYDLSSTINVVTLDNYLNETKLRNGWLILYFSDKAATSIEPSKNIVKLRGIFEIIKRSGIPIVLQAQVLKVSQ